MNSLSDTRVLQITWDLGQLSRKSGEVVPEEGVEPTQSKAPADFESAASASSATPGQLEK